MMMIPDVTYALAATHQRELLREAARRRLLAGAVAGREDGVERFVHWLGGELALTARHLEAYARPRPLCPECG